jgi:hypothetical protein
MIKKNKLGTKDLIMSFLLGVSIGMALLLVYMMIATSL